ncbi:MAG: hypothetical protein ACLRH0_05345 [Blautia wexlerae]
MASVVIRKIPEIVLIDKSELGTMEIFTLNMLYKTDISEFVDMSAPERNNIPE